MNFLKDILDRKAMEVEERKKAIPVAALKEHPLFAGGTRSLAEAIRSVPFAVVAEVKRASPSKGIIRPDFDPVDIARRYAQNGAVGISVLTDEKFFQGSLGHLEAIRAHVELPLLRKDFIIDSYQLYEAKAAGADAVLLIVGALPIEKLRSLMQEASALGMESLVEVHNGVEIEGANAVGCKLIGINNRDLATFATSLWTTVHLSRYVDPKAVCLSESGIKDAGDIATLKKAGVHAVLIGEAFMSAEDPGAALASFLAMASEAQ